MITRPARKCGSTMSLKAPIAGSGALGLAEMCRRIELARSPSM
jgi:hypothetical protein